MKTPAETTPAESPPSRGTERRVQLVDDHPITCQGVAALVNQQLDMQIAKRLNLSVKTIDFYREHLKVKLHIDDAPDLLQHATRWTKTKHLA